MKDFNTNIEDLKAALMYAYQNWAIWWFIRNEKFNHGDVYNRYLIFFTNSQIAHFITTITSIWHLIDEKYFSVASFYKELRDSNNLSPEIIEDINNRFNTIEHIKKGVILIRHNLVAHLSDKIDGYDVFKKANIDGEDLRDFIVQLGNILNIIIDSIDGTPIAFTLCYRPDRPNEIITESDVKILFDDLERLKL